MIAGTVRHRMVQITMRLRLGFARTAPRSWEATTAACELLVQCGHLAQCLGTSAHVPLGRVPDPSRHVSDLGDELSDIALSALSVTVLADGEPTDDDIATAERCLPPLNESHELAPMIPVLAASGQLAEAAMVATGFRHRPVGNPRVFA